MTIKPITLAMLQGMTNKERQTIYQRAREKASPQADDIIELLFQRRLLDSAGGGLSRGHSIVRSIEAICRSPEALNAACSAIAAGQAPMAGVDPLLRAGIREYGHFDTTSWAGTFVAEEVEAAGYVRVGRKTLPSTCIARTAAAFEVRA